MWAGKWSMTLIARRWVGLQTLWWFRLKDLSIDKIVGSDALAVCHAHRGLLLDFFCSGIQFNLLLSPYLCFICFLYLDIYVLGDDALISQGSFMQTKDLCVLIHIWTEGEVGAPLNRFKPSSKVLYWLFQGGTSCLVLAMPLCASVHMCLVVTCWERADLLDLLCGV